jgi:hypothetical protein
MKITEASKKVDGKRGQRGGVTTQAVYVLGAGPTALTGDKCQGKLAMDQRPIQGQLR